MMQSTTPRRMLQACALLPCLLRSSAFTGTSLSTTFARSLTTTTTTTTTTAASSTSSSSSNSMNANPNLLTNCAPSSLHNSFFALRHGQSLANVEGRIASNPAKACTSSGLSELGHEQAEQAGHNVVQQFSDQLGLDTNKYDGLLILSSDLLRAAETANHVLQAAVKAGLPVYSDKVVTEIRLRERWFGDWDDTTDANYHEVWKDDLIDPSHCKANVESVDAVMERATFAILDWDEKVQNHFVICVAHGDVLQILQTAFFKMHGSQHRSLEHLETATLRPLELQEVPVSVPPPV